MKQLKGDKDLPPVMTAPRPNRGVPPEAVPCQRIPLCGHQEEPHYSRSWAEYAEGRPLTPRQLAQLLAGFRIRAKQIRQGAATRKGYLRADFTDAFRRYLPLVLSESATP